MIKKYFVKYPVFLYLLPVFFVVHGFTENYDLIPVKDAVLLILFYIGVATIITLLFWMLYRNFHKANLVTFFLLSYQFFFGSVFDFLSEKWGNSFLTRYNVILPTSFVLFILIVVIVKKTKRPFLRVTLFLNMLLLLFILTDTSWLIMKAGANKKKSATPIETFVVCDSYKKPDIYLIITDGYPGKQVLNNAFNFDNSPFETELKKRNFQVIENTTSNYTFTMFSMASMLNINYLKDVSGKINSKTDWPMVFKALKQSNVLQFLATNGYQFYNYSIFDFHENPSLISTTSVSRKTKPIISQTFLYRLNRDLGYHLITKLGINLSPKRLISQDLDNNNKFYKLTTEIAKKAITKPKFVYTHLLMPHHPYYFDSTGQAVSFNKLTYEFAFDRKAFISYLKYSNKKFIELIDHIRTSSTKPPIIILMSDHGFREFGEEVDRKYRFMNLNAVLLPDSNYSGFYNGQSNVNQFRIILNSQFGQHLPLLKDSMVRLSE